MATSAGDFDGALRGLLSANVFEVDEKLLRFLQKPIAIGFQRGNTVARIHKVNYVEQRFHGINIDSANHGGLASVGLRNDQARDFFQASFEGDGKRASNTTNAAIEAQLADEQAIFDCLLRQASVGSDNAKSHGQVES